MRNEETVHDQRSRGQDSHGEQTAPAQILTIRSHSGVAGDMLFCGLAVLLATRENTAPDSREFAECLNSIARGILPALDNCLKIRPHAVAGIFGWQAEVSLPHAHEHRSLDDVRQIVEAAAIADTAKNYASQCFELLANCEAEAHGITPAKVHFHEVGALDSILDICLSAELYVRLGCPVLNCAPLPLADGEIGCAHGILPAPAPAVLRLLHGVPVRPFNGDANAGELVTPTGIALLRSFQAAFSAWPNFQIQATAIVYGQKTFPHAANGLIFALGFAPGHSAEPWQSHCH